MKTLREINERIKRGKADAFATAIGNQVRKGCHPESIIELYKDLPAVCIIWEGKLYYKGLFEILF